MAEFRVIDLRLSDSSVGKATALGNNAAWLCPCGYTLPLIASLTIAKQVSCPNPKCGRRYRLQKDAENRAAAVQEVTSPL
jgi:hypothetical protein